MLDQAASLRKLVADSEFNSCNIHKIKPKIITITSGKGGVGKSNFVVNLSIAIQNTGKKVLVFDADIGMGNDDVLMGFYPKYNVFDIIFNNKDIGEVVITGHNGVKLLPGGSGLSKIEELTKEQRDLFLEKLVAIQNVDYILMDTGAGINKTVLAFAACCEELILITTPEPTSLTDAYSLAKAIDHFKLKDKVSLIVNRVLDTREGRVTFSKFKNAVDTFLKIDVEYLGCIREDRKLIQSVRQQIPFIINYPNCDASKNIVEIARKIQGLTNDNSTNIQGFFRKIFNILS
ncbi:flagellum site-determining protein YlxH [Clostridium tepidiprofundi DSM 19306]|uniref:Flagellum site-determining protein YlxH n=1 Tax=Clostridium tepidiprofundi DSM 19306 TaxID=1121338 RepID=A0A151B7J4_9CLOT|nr:MinD/ParA family protein [Clostridium tepidiprofundi]KYH35617.1 flagellum site-determining protein YlxH [Clostridium tepidiprofundi DSM 19306]